MPFLSFLIQGLADRDLLPKYKMAWWPASFSAVTFRRAHGVWLHAFGFWEQIQSSNVGCGGQASLKEEFWFCRRLKCWQLNDWSLVTEPMDWTPFPARNTSSKRTIHLLVFNFQAEHGRGGRSRCQACQYWIAWRQWPQHWWGCSSNHPCRMNDQDPPSAFRYHAHLSNAQELC